MKITILLAEDSVADQKLFELALEDAGDTQLEIVSDGSEALLFLKKVGKYADAPRPDLVVLDLNLPKVSGFEILAEMRKSPTLKPLPVVLFSGAKPTSEMLMACEGANLYVVKPDGMEKYFAIVKSLANYCRDILKFPDLTDQYTEAFEPILEGSERCDVYFPSKRDAPNGSLMKMSA